MTAKKGHNVTADRGSRSASNVPNRLARYSERPPAGRDGRVRPREDVRGANRSFCSTVTLPA
jgi:hypothetical protein